MTSMDSAEGLQGVQCEFLALLTLSPCLCVTSGYPCDRKPLDKIWQFKLGLSVDSSQNEK